MNIIFEQKFHPIGQGLFYSSAININDKITANIIFDCGSENIDLIKNAIEELNMNKIDVLIISHLHFDHISGLNYIIEKNIKVRTVVLPYLYPYERTIIQSINNNKPQWYINFLQNPYLFLSEYVENVIIINGSDDESGYSVNIPEEIPPLNDEYINEGIYNNLEKVDKDTKNAIIKKEKLSTKNNISIMKDKGYIIISYMFISFFNYKISNDKKVKEFKNFLKKEIRNEILNGMIRRDSKIKLRQLTDKEELEKLKKSYEIINKDLNITSLAAFQGLLLPLNNRSMRSFSFHRNDTIQLDYLQNIGCNDDGYFEGHFHGHFREGFQQEFYYDYFYDCHNNPNYQCMLGTLLLGDIKLDYKSKRQKELFKHFENLLQFIKLVQLSHHGAINGWNNNLINMIPGNTLFIASYKTANKYKHPHKKVIIELVENNRSFFSVTEKNGYSNRIEFYD